MEEKKVLTEEVKTRIQTRRKELVIRGWIVLILLILSVAGMIVMDINHVSSSGINYYRMITLILLLVLYWGYIFPIQNGIGKEIVLYPELRKAKLWKYPLPSEWKVLHWLVGFGGFVLVAFSFFVFYKPMEVVDPAQYNHIERTVPSISVPSEYNSNSKGSE